MLKDMYAILTLQPGDVKQKSQISGLRSKLSYSPASMNVFMCACKFCTTSFV